ncbi:MAG: hypothetical protein HKN26_00020, partial [Acidimicrobiales bacterium]|nr:hypothetical protein [Acidimicrobiales bacterium]
MQQRYRRTVFGFLAAVLVGAFLVPTAATASTRRAPTRYLVTIENLSNQPLTPPVLATHSAAVSAFAAGAPASPGIQGLAENGDVPGLVAELSSNRRMIGSVQVAEAGDPPPLEAGESVTVEIDALRRHRRLTIASMLICTNDGFAAAEIRLPGRAGLQTTHYLNSYDAGTERNTEDFDDLVPPCGPLTGVD